MRSTNFTKKQLKKLPKPKSSLDYKIARKINKYAWMAKRNFTETRREVRLDINRLCLLKLSYQKKIEFSGAISAIHEITKKGEIKKSIVIWVKNAKPIISGLGYTPNSISKLYPHFYPDGAEFVAACNVLHFMAEFPDFTPPEPEKRPEPIQLAPEFWFEIDEKSVDFNEDMLAFVVK